MRRRRLVYAAYLQQGVDLISSAGLSETDRQALNAYWNYIILDGMTGGIQAVAQERQNADAFVESYVYETRLHWCIQAGVPAPDLVDVDCKLAPFGGKFTLWFIVGSLGFDCVKSYVELSLSTGAGFSGKLGWNYKTKTPILGIGYGVNLDKIVNLGGTLKFNPEKGFEGAASFTVPGKYLPIKPSGLNLPIAKFNVFLN